MTFNLLFKRSLIIIGWCCVIFSALFFSIDNPFISKKNNTLRIFSWSDTISQDVIKKFEKQTGIKIHIDYYSSNEELIVKLKNLKHIDYDLIIPSDYAVSMLAEEGVLQPLDRSQLHFLGDLNPLLLGHEYDPNNTYSLPIEWDIYGFGIDTDVFKNADTMEFTLDHLFNEEVINYKIAMTNDPIDAFCFASCYLFGFKHSLTSKEALMVKNLLLEQKKHVEAYAVPRADYVLGSKNAALALSLSSYVLRSQEHFPFMKFVIPKHKTFISIENIAIPKGAQHLDLAYQFLNFMYEPENLAAACNTFDPFPATMSAIEFLDYKDDYQAILKQLNHDSYEFYFFKHLMPEQKLRSLWIEIKS